MLNRKTCLLLIALGVLTLLSACGDKAINVTTLLSNTQDIKKDTPVYWDDTIVGKVSNVSSIDNGSLLQLSLDKVAASNISSNAAVVVNRLKEGVPIEIYNPATADQQMLQDGQELTGLDSMFQLGAWMVGDAIQLGSESVSEYVGAFQKYLQSDQFQTDKTQLQAQVSRAAEHMQKAMETVEQDVNNAVQELSVSENEMAAAMEDIGDELAPVAQELARSGSLLVERLEQFTQSLEKTNAQERQAGQKFMESLLATLERLNESIEAGLNASDQTGEEIETQ